MGTEEKILDVAENAARGGGYNGFSFRDIASEIGIKSASIHYHFPTKGDLGKALAERYTDRFFDALPDPKTASLKDALNAYVGAFRSSSQNDGKMCLCGMMAAEINALPEPVAKATRDFFKRNLDWLENALTDLEPNADARLSKALALLAGLEGALIARRGLGVPSGFDVAAMEIVQGVTGETIDL